MVQENCHKFLLKNNRLGKKSSICEADSLADLATILYFHLPTILHRYRVVQFVGNDVHRGTGVRNVSSRMILLTRGILRTHEKSFPWIILFARSASNGQN
jgi:hypothetical protein